MAASENAKKWMNLGYEDPATIGLLEPEWNDFDKLTPATRMILDAESCVRHKLSLVFQAIVARL